MAGGNVEFGIRLSADSTAFVSNVETSKRSIESLGAAATKAGEDVAAGQRQVNDMIAAQTRAMSSAASQHQQSRAGVSANLEAQRQLDDELTRFLSVTDKAYRAQLLMDKGADLLHRSLQSGIITQAQYDTRLASLVARFGPAAAGATTLKAANEGIGISAGFAAREARVLVDELASGRTSQAVGTFTNVAGRILMVQPVAAAAGIAVLGLGGAFVYTVAKAESLNRSLAQTEAILTATGRGGKISEAELQKAIQGLERLSGISRDAAEQIVRSFAKAQQIGPELFGRLTGLVADFAAATGEDVPKAAQKLAEAFKDPVKGAKSLDDELNILTSDQVLQLEAMKRTGDVVGAQDLLYRALHDRVDGLHKQALTPLQARMESLAGAWRKVMDELGNSTAVKLATDAMMGFLRVVEWLIEKLPTLASRAKVAALAMLPGGQAVGAILSALAARSQGSASAPTGTAAQQAAGGAANGSSTLDQFEVDKKKLEERTQGFKTAAQAEAEMREQAKALTAALAEMDARGEQNTTTYKRFRDALEAINERTAPTFESRVAVITRTLQAQQAAAQTSYSLIKDSLDREAQLLEVRHAAQLVGEQTFLARRLAIDRQEVQARIALLEEEVRAEAAAYVKIALAHPNNKSDAARQTADLEASRGRLIKLTGDLSKAEAALDAQQEQGRTRQLILDQRVFDEQVKIGHQVADFLTRLRDEDEERRFQLTLLGQTEEVQARLTAERARRLAIEREIESLTAKIADEEAKGAGKNQLTIVAAQTEIARLKDLLPGAVKSAGDLAENTALAARNASTLTSAWQRVDDFLYGVLDHFKGGWKEAAQYAREQILQYIQRTLYELTLQRFGISVFANLTNAGPGTFAGSSPATSVLASLGGSVANGVGNFASSLGLSSVANLIGGATGALQGPTLTGAALGGSAAGFGAVLSQALPYIGVALAIASMFAKPGGGPKEGGSFFGGFDATGRFTGTSRVAGSDNGRFFTPSGRDSDLRSVVTDLAGSYFSTLTGLGGKAPSGVQFGLGYDTDPQGTAPNRISSAVTIGGRQVFGSQDRAVGRDQSTLEAELKLEASRSLLAALQASELPSSVARIINSLDVRTATQEAIDDALSFAQVYQQLKAGQGDFVKDAKDLYEAQTNGSREAVRKQGEALAELARKSDGSTASLQQLAQAQSSYRQSLVQLLASIHAMQDEATAMFSQTREKIQLAGLNPQDTYNFLQGAADQRFAALQAAKDPGEVQRLAKEVNDYYLRAFDLLSPEDQIAHKQEFLDHLNDLDTSVNKKLGDLANAIAEESQKPFDIVGDKMEAAVDHMASVVDRFDSAVGRIERVADNPPPPTVVYVGSGPSEVSAG